LITQRRLASPGQWDADVLLALVKRLNAIGWTEEAAQLALTCWDSAPRVLSSAASALAAHRQTLPLARVRIAGFSTTHDLAQDLSPAFAACGWQADVSEARFGEGLAELLNPGTDCDCLVLLMDISGFAPGDWRRTPHESFELLRERADLLAVALAGFCERAHYPLLINTIPSPPAPTAGLLDRQHALGLRRMIDLVNQRILEVAERAGRMLVCDADTALAQVPLVRQTDPKLWYYGRLAYSPAASRALAASFAQAWRTLKLGPLKVVAVDFDNTLWGGVYGEDGLDALVCGSEFPGNAYSAFQEECLRLKRQGMLLVGLSKNNPDAISVFERRPEMVLKTEDFIATAVNWQPKPDNIRRIAAELGLGLDSFLFLDDSPHEREAMRQICPAVTVPEMPADPAQRPLWLRRLTPTWPVRLTTEDLQRSEMYAAGRAAKALKAGAVSLADYLRGLEQRLCVELVRRETLPRVAQMHQRTNQFNLTSIRLTESELGGMVEDASSHVAMLGRVSDRFGDHGIVIAATARLEGDCAQILTFLMSCRVIGREVENAFLGALLGELEKRGVRTVKGTYVASPKNAQCRDFYASAGFRPVSSEPSRSDWLWTFGEAELPGSAAVTTRWGS
jgi:FkbH-like protein